MKKSGLKSVIEETTPYLRQYQSDNDSSFQTLDQGEVKNQFYTVNTAQDEDDEFPKATKQPATQRTSLLGNQDLKRKRTNESPEQIDVLEDDKPQSQTQNKKVTKRDSSAGGSLQSKLTAKVADMLEDGISGQKLVLKQKVNKKASN